MHKTEAGERRKALKREALVLARDAKVLQKAAKTLPKARQEAQRLQKEVKDALTKSEALKLQARLEDLTVWEMEKTKSYRTYTYWMASWRDGEKVRNIHWEAPEKWMLERPCRRPGS